MRASSWLPREPTSAGAPDTAPCRTRVHTTTGLRQDSACTDTPARAAPSTAAEAARALAPAEAESALAVAVSAPGAVGGEAPVVGAGELAGAGSGPGFERAHAWAWGPWSSRRSH